ncbi:MAG: leucine-rich repeat protein, partial [Clostridiales bacterium]|nr:leucine-rich repeat protein [Clostridiales bacterium]
MTVKFKKIFVVLFSICVLLGAFYFNASAAETLTEGDYQYIIVTSDDLSEEDLAYGVTVGSARITGYTATTPSIALPATLGGKTVESIGSGAFSGNTALQSVTIGTTYKVIGSEAFKNCTGLQQVLVASSVTSIYSSAFSGCTALKTIQFDTGSLLATIGNYAFDGCTSLNNLALPDGLEAIGEFAFRNNDSLVSIEIPDSVTSLGGAAFFGCDSMRTAIIGNGVETIANAYQSYGDNWGTDSWRDGAFEGCVSLTSVTIGSSVSSIEQDCFAGSGLTSLSLPDNVITIGEAAFLNCTSLKTVETGNGLTEIGAYAFKYDAAIETVAIGTSVLTIGNEAFRECDAIVTITIPSNVTTLGSGAFFHCDSLKTVIIGNGVTSLDSSYSSYGDDWGTDSSQDGTFEGCISLTSVTLGSGIISIGQDCFAGTALINVTIPDNVITVSEGAFKNCTDLTSITIGDGVTSIGDWIFEGDTALSDVNIGSGVISIGTGAFVDCTGLEYIYIPSNVTTLGGAAFFGCDSLTTAVIGNGVTDLNTRYAYGGRNWGTDSSQDGTFEGCISLTSVTLGSGIISIGQDSFAGTQITTLTVPAKVSTLGYGAFAGATQLSSIYFTGNWPASVGENILSNTAEGITLYYISGSVGYDDLSYSLSAFTPVTVSFDNNNSSVFAITTEEQILSPLGGYVIEPVSPAALGYLFDGWYKDSACTVKWNFTEDKVTSNTTLYAKWNAVDTVVPVRPEGVSTSAYDGASVTLTWSAVDGAISYNVYQDGVKVNTEAITATTYTVTGLDSNTTYEFEVAA